MSVEYKKDSNGKCPVMHGGVTKAGESQIPLDFGLIVLT